MYDKETVELAMAALSWGMRPAQVARELGIGDTTVRCWADGGLPRSAAGKPVDSPLRERPRGAGMGGNRHRGGDGAEAREAVPAAERAAELEAMSAPELRELVLSLEMDVAIARAEAEILKKTRAPTRRPSRARRGLRWPAP